MGIGLSTCVKIKTLSPLAFLRKKSLAKYEKLFSARKVKVQNQKLTYPFSVMRFLNNQYFCDPLSELLDFYSSFYDIKVVLGDFNLDISHPVIWIYHIPLFGYITSRYVVVYNNKTFINLVNLTFLFSGGKGIDLNCIFYLNCNCN